MTGRSKHRGLGVALAAGLLWAVALAGAVPALAASVTFGTPTANSVFGEGITFTQPVSGLGSFREVNFVVRYPGSIGPSLTRLEAPGKTKLVYELDASEGQLQPNTRLKAWFQVVFADGSVQTGPEIAVTYSDTRFKWKTKVGSVVRLHWYSGSDSFAADALELADKSVASAMEFMGTKSTDPIDFFVYADQEDFYKALGPGMRENVGGLANTVTRTLFALIEPGDVGYTELVVPHELAHVIYDEKTRNAYHYPPHWLNEGIATYLTEGYAGSDRSRVTRAASGGTLMPLAALAGQFPTSRERFYLAYAESVSAVDFFIKTHGREGMAKLLTAFGEGASDDEAFTAATGAGVSEFDSAWMASVGAKPVSSFGPLPAPAGALPPGWVGADGATAPPPVASGATPAASDGGSSPPDGEGGSSGVPVPALLAAIAGVIVVVAVASVLLMKRRRALTPTPPGEG